MPERIEPKPNGGTAAAPPPDVGGRDPYAAVASQAAAMAVQDAAAHMRNTQTIASAVFGAAEEMILRQENVKLAGEAMTSAENAMRAAVDHFERVSEAAAKMLRQLPEGD